LKKVINITLKSTTILEYYFFKHDNYYITMKY